MKSTFEKRSFEEKKLFFAKNSNLIKILIKDKPIEKPKPEPQKNSKWN